MELIWLIMVGVIVGLIAKATMSVHDTKRSAVLVLVGVAGAIIAGHLGLARLIASAVGAAVLVFLYRREHPHPEGDEP